MPDRITNQKVDEFLSRAEKWREEFVKLRAIVLDCGLDEDFKWGVPCYTSEGKNIVLIHGFKDYCAILFVKGALLHDENGILIQQTENVQSGRQVRFTNASEIDVIEPVLKIYIQEAVGIEKAGLEVEMKTEFTIPEELLSKFGEVQGLKAAFETLTPGRQRAYIFYFSQPKQSKTRELRIDKYTPQILAGKGLNDQQ
jgi:uncharacterized protein YdeI (YjbR/CyaY-like superfamily)